MLSAEQRGEFEARGLLRLPGLVDVKVVSDLRERVLAQLSERRLLPDPVPPGFGVNPSRLAVLTNKLAFESLWGTRASEVVDDLLGAGRWRRPDDAGQVLAMTWPDANATWLVPNKSWHLDYMAPTALEHLTGLQLFVCADRVERHAGGTLVACGTHRLIDAVRRREARDWQGRSADVRGRLKAAVPWMRELCSLREGEDREARFMDRSTAFEGVDLQVVELAGEPGDVFAMHPWLMHSLSRNCGARPRLVVTQRLHASGF